MDRKNFIKLISLAMASPIVVKAEDALRELNKADLTEKMPVIFIGHGNPMNALADNNFTKALAKIEKTVAKPKAILVVSAHWLTRGTYVSVNKHPKTIYDFG